MIIFNNSNIITSTGPIEISIDGRHITILKRREFVDVSIEHGKHELSVRHKELLINKYYQNDYSIEISTSDIAIEVYTGIASTKFKFVNELPKSFETKFIKKTEF